MRLYVCAHASTCLCVKRQANFSADGSDCPRCPTMTTAGNKTGRRVSTACLQISSVTFDLTPGSERLTANEESRIPPLYTQAGCECIYISLLARPSSIAFSDGQSISTCNCKCKFAPEAFYFLKSS